MRHYQDGKDREVSEHEVDGEQGTGQVDDITATRLVGEPAQDEVVRGQERKRVRAEEEYTHPHTQRERGGARFFFLGGGGARGSGADLTLSFCNF